MGKAVFLGLILLAVRGCPAEKFGRKFYGGRNAKGGLLHYNFKREDMFPKAGSSVVLFNFTQKLDNFNPQDNRTWIQRVWMNDDFYSHENGGPVFLYLGGEGPTTEDIIDSGGGWEWMLNAKRHNALCFQLEHRYYGLSHPVPDLKTENMQWLSSRQALADMANFIESMNKQHNLKPGTKWISFGGSYAGALSAWARLKYPHLIHAAIATSAVVEATIDNKGYLDVVAKDILEVDEKCYSTIYNATAKIERLLETDEGRKQIKHDFNHCNQFNSSGSNNARLFMQFLSEKFMGDAQYSGVVQMKFQCQGLLDTPGDDSYERYANYNKDKSRCNDIDYDFYVSGFMDTHLDEFNMRNWYYQKCTELGYFKTTQGKFQPFGTKVTPQYMQQICSRAYGSKFTYDFTEAAISKTQEYYGGLNLQGTRIFLPNGAFDPWHAVGIDVSDTIERPAYLIKDGTHCSNMYPAESSDTTAIKVARKLAALHLEVWLNE